MRTLRRLVLAGAVALTLTIPASSVTVSANDYWISCGMFEPVSTVAGYCVEWNNGVVTFYEFDWNGNWWTY